MITRTCAMSILIIVALTTNAFSQFSYSDLRSAINQTRELRKGAKDLKETCRDLHHKLDKDTSIDYTKKVGVMGMLLLCKDYAYKAQNLADRAVDKMSLPMSYLSGHDCLDCLQKGQCSTEGHFNNCRERFSWFQEGAQLSDRARKAIQKSYKKYQKAMDKIKSW